MLERYKALLFILALTLPIMAWGRSLFRDSVLHREDTDERIVSWVALLLIAFLIPNPWVYICTGGLWMAWRAYRSHNPLALFLFLLLVLPPISLEVPGFGSIAYFFSIDHLRLATIAILGVAFFRLRREKEIEPFGRFGMDWLVISFLALQLVLLMRIEPTPTVVLRAAFESSIDAFLPYMIASRSARSLRGLKDCLGSLAFAILLLVPITLFEISKSWLLYNELGFSQISAYLMRDGNLRPIGTAGHNLALGMILAVGVGIFPALRPYVSKRKWQLTYAFIILGLFASLARGSYVGAAVSMAVLAATGRGGGTRFLKLIAGVVCVTALVSLTPLADKVIRYVPFLGNVDSDNITYRQRLFDTSMQVIDLHPFFGEQDFMVDPIMEPMRQGQGIIDIVNSYLAVALQMGYVGLTLYLLMFLTALVSLYQSIGRVAKYSFELELAGRCIFATLISMMVIIATASSILAIPYFIWIFLGFSVAFSRLTDQVVVKHGSPIGSKQQKALSVKTMGAR